MVYGIDLGTTYSVIAGCDEHNMVHVFNNGEDHGSTVTPSVVLFKETGKPVVGTVAKGRMQLRGFGEQTISLFKLQMGQLYCNETVMFQNVPRQVSPVEGSACVLHYLRSYAFMNQRNDQNMRAVVTVPTSFSFEQRSCTKKAAELAGIEVLGLLQEPTAAAISYDIQAGETVLVFDLGGGTLDVSIVKNEFGNYRVLGVASDSDVVGMNKHIGGKDWDDKLVEFALNKLPIGIDKDDRYKMAKLRNEAEKCKIALTKFNAHLFAYNDDVVQITRADFERITRSLVNDCMNVVEKAIEDAQKNIRTGELKIDRFVLAGGSSNMPMIKSALIRRFAARYSDGRLQDEWLHLQNPERAIAEGAAKYASLIDRGMVEKIIDKSPYSYGTLLKEDNIEYIQNLLSSSDPMVMQEGRVFSFCAADYRGVNVDVYENNNPSVESFVYKKSECRLIGEKYYYYFDHDVEIGTLVQFTVTRDKDGLIGIVVSSEGHHEERFSIDTVTSPISPEVEAQIRRTIELMDQEE